VCIRLQSFDFSPCGEPNTWCLPWTYHSTPATMGVWQFFSSLLTSLLTCDSHLTLSYPCGLVLDWYILTAQFGHLTHGLWWFTDARPCFFLFVCFFKQLPLTVEATHWLSWHIFPTAILTSFPTCTQATYVATSLPSADKFHIYCRWSHIREEGEGWKNRPNYVTSYTHCVLVGRWLTWMAWSFRAGGSVAASDRGTCILLASPSTTASNDDFDSVIPPSWSGGGGGGRCSLCSCDPSAGGWDSLAAVWLTWWVVPLVDIAEDLRRNERSIPENNYGLTLEQLKPNTTALGSDTCWNMRLFERQLLRMPRNTNFPPFRSSGYCWWCKCPRVNSV